MRTLHVIQSTAASSGGPIEGVNQLMRYRLSANSDAYIDIASLEASSNPSIHHKSTRIYPLRRFWYDYLFPISMLLWINKNKNNYDIIVVNAIWNFHGFVTWLSLRNSSIPYMVFTHGMLDPWFKRTYPLKHIKKWLFWPWAIFPVLRDADRVVFTCNKERDLARESFWLYSCREFVVPYGTQGIPDPAKDYTTSLYEKFPEIKSHRCLLFLGRVHPKKGPDILMHAIASLKKQQVWREREHLLVMAGPCEGSYARKLIQLSKRLGIQNSILWTGMLQGDQKWAAFQSSDAFILPSHQENFGIAVAEALSASTPVLITHAVNISPEIAAYGAGFVSEDTIPGITNLISRWLQVNSAKRLKMSQSARECFLHRFTINGFAEAMEALSEQVIEERIESSKEALGNRGMSNL